MEKLEYIANIVTTIDGVIAIMIFLVGAISRLHKSYCKYCCQLKSKKDNKNCKYSPQNGSIDTPQETITSINEDNHTVINQDTSNTNTNIVKGNDNVVIVVGGQNQESKKYENFNEPGQAQKPKTNEDQQHNNITTTTKKAKSNKQIFSQSEKFIINQFSNNKAFIRLIKIESANYANKGVTTKYYVENENIRTGKLSLKSISEKDINHLLKLNFVEQKTVYKSKDIRFKDLFDILKNTIPIDIDHSNRHYFHLIVTSKCKKYLETSK